MTALDVVEIGVSYGERDVLHGVSLSVAAGEVVGLVGPNGCGKTTLLKAVAGAVPLRSGEVLIEGEPVAGLSGRERARRVAVLPQLAGLPPRLRALDAVVMGRTPYLGFFSQEGPEDYAIARRAIERVGAAELAGRDVGELSGGERQTILLARALAQQSPILLLDEPTASLDIGHQMSLFALVRDLAASEGRAVLAALHDLTLASLYCDRLVLLAGGQVVAEGSPASVLSLPNIEAAYGARATILFDAGIPAPVVVPYAGAGEPAAAVSPPGRS
jgi:iron complex transport system ATP-binding protein